MALRLSSSRCTTTTTFAKRLLNTHRQQNNIKKNEGQAPSLVTSTRRVRNTLRHIAAGVTGMTAGESSMTHQHGNMTVHMVPALSDNYMYLLHEQSKNKLAVIDPAEIKPIQDALKSRGLKNIDYIFNTHHHWDHTQANEDVKQIHKCDVYGFEGDRDRIPGIDLELKEDSEFLFGSEPVRVILTPGHTSGHICYYFPESKICFAGDTLFAMGCGRLFEGTPKQMYFSLEKLKTVLPRDTTIYCGHEYTLSNAKFAKTVDSHNEALEARYNRVVALREQNLKTVPFTFEEELNTNPFLRCDSEDLKRCIGMEDVQDPVEVFTKVRSLKDNF